MTGCEIRLSRPMRREESFQVTIRHEIQEARELTTLAIRAPQRTI